MGRETDDSVSEFLKFRQILSHRTTLSELEETTSGIIIVRRCETGLKSLNEGRPGGELAVRGHPLEPGESPAVHVEGHNGKSVVFEGSVVLKILINLEYPPEGVSTIKTRNV